MRNVAVAAICFASVGAMAQDANTVIANAQKALGDVKSITYSGTAKDVAFQQCGANAADMQCRGTHDPMRPINNYVRVIDLAGPASRATGSTMNIGAGGSTTVAPGTFFQQVTPQQADVSQPWGNSLELYITPWGFLKGAAANNATVNKKRVEGKNYTVLTWSPAVKAASGKSYTINGYVDDKNMVDRVETWLGENIMGDMHILAVYSGWKDFGGVMAPAKIVQTRGGWPFFEVDVTSAKANPPDVATLVPAPAAGRGGAGGGAPGGPPALNVTSEKLGDGIYRLTTGPGSYDSVIVEFKDYIMMLEAGQSIARGQAYIAETKRLIPNKPIRYVFNTHPHSDHTGGLPALVAEGAIIITQKNNEKFLSDALNTPRTLLTDVLAQNPKKAKFETIDEKKVYSDGTRVVEMYHTWPVPHSNGLAIAFLPKEKILFQGDFSVNPGEAANDHVNALVPILQRLNLDYDRYINVHASAAPQHKADVMKAYEMRQASAKK
ncbi:MAG: MBL fold metallo-hydrolase [Bryobacterales bacterium]|nr:MBL fold metallo-hydrolase [Bryobacterales bacterium]MBV9399265.1 MBL fold metallo-hydrolase [Bryobacterales bacterium]